jgi:hypothetical protein
MDRIGIRGKRDSMYRFNTHAFIDQDFIKAVKRLVIYSQWKLKQDVVVVSLVFHTWLAQGVSYKWNGVSRKEPARHWRSVICYTLDRFPSVRYGLCSGLLHPGALRKMNSDIICLLNANLLNESDYA